MASSQHRFVPSVLVAIVILSLASCLLAAAATANHQVPVKRLQGPPNEFASHRLPNPLQAALSSQGAMFGISFLHDKERNVWTFDEVLPVDSKEFFRLTLVAKEMDFLTQLKLTFTNPSGAAVDVPVPVEGFFGWSDNKAGKALTWQIDTPAQGTWKLHIESALPDPHIGTGRPSAAAILENHGPLMAFSHIADSYMSLRVGQSVGLRAQLMDDEAHKAKLIDLGISDQDHSTARKVRPDVPSMASIRRHLGLAADESDPVIRGNVEVKFPDGSEAVLSMREDSSEGAFSAKFTATQAGVYVASVDMKGYTSKGLVFHRTQQHVFRVVDPAGLEIRKDRASVALQRQKEVREMLRINLHLTSTHKSLLGRKVRAYAEVWAKDAKDNQIPVAWIGGMTYVDKMETANSTAGVELVLPLEMSIKWLSRVQAKLPLTLKNVYVQDPDSSVPLCEADEIKVTQSRIHELNKVIPTSLMNDIVSKYSKETYRFDARRDAKSESMYFGVRPQENRLTAVLNKRKQAQTKGVPSAGHRLVLVHGYCASDIPFNTEAFTGFSIFLDPDANRSNDEFALLLREFGTQFSSFSALGHSQGGLALLHLYTFYWSTLDNSEHLVDGKLRTSSEARLLQSVGSPYHGSSLAGGIAAIGDLIGVGCGKNTDLTHDGAELWLSTIPAASREQLYYYTSQYKPFSWCVMAAQAVLKWPNDGTTEKSYSQLEGGQFVNHKESQCHSDNMKYLAQCRDDTRSKEMNEKAARS